MPTAANGVISGVVLNERQEPVAHAQVQAFSVLTTIPDAQHGQTVPFSMRGSGSASTDTEGRFHISGLESGEYLVRARMSFGDSSRLQRKSSIATTRARFHHSWPG
jgi:protocatechuate 3,4-dioxygenase beta subunit